MQRRKSIAKKLFFAGITACVVMLLVLIGCPTDTGSKPNPGSTGRLPEKPIVTKTEDGLDFTDDVDISSQSAVDAALTDPSKVKAAISLVWEGAGADSYNIYWSDEAFKPTRAGATGIKDRSYFIRGLDLQTKYYIWVEAVNAKGNITSNMVERSTRASDLERGDYPRNIKTDPDNGQLTVWWDLSDRVGWYEVYYAPVGAISHVDAYTPYKFKWDGYLNPQDVITPQGTLAAAYAEYTRNDNPNDWPHAVPFGANTYYFSGYTAPIYPFLSPLASEWTGYNIGRTSGLEGDGRPVVGQNKFGDPDFPIAPANAFPYIFESWKEGDGGNDLGKLQPYTPLDARFNAADVRPWDGTKNGTQGKAVRLYKNSVTITGLTNGTQYEVWIRCPNINGERGYGYVIGTPGSSGLPVPANINVTTPPDTTRDLEISWNAVEGATSYRLYFSSFDKTPGPTDTYTRIEATEESTYTVTKSGLTSNTSYYVWVVAEKNGVAGEKGKSVSGKTGTAPANGIKGQEKKIVGTDNVVKTLMYVEVNDNNPLNAGSYILEDGSYLFDYVVLFASNIRNRNCAVETEGHGCTKSGVHVHHNANNRHILTNASKYIKPLQDKGIKVLMCILGDHDGISIGSMTDAQRTTFVNDLKQDIELYGLDGVDLDDEWGSKEDWTGWTNNYENISPNSIWVYPVSSWGWPTSVTVYRDPTMGVVAGNGTRTANSAEDQSRMWRELGVGSFKTIAAIRTALGQDKIITVYEYNTGRYITPDAGGTNSLDPTVTNLGGILDFTLNPMYNQYLTNSANGLPPAQYGSLAIDVGGGAYASQNGAPNPPQNTTGTDSITDYATRFKTAVDPYGYICLYGLNPASSLLKVAPNSPTATVTKEDYLSIMTQIVFGQKTVLTAEGGDYRKDW